MDELTSMMCEMITPIHLQKRMNREAHTRSWVTTGFLNLPKPNTKGSQKQELTVKYLYLLNQIFTSSVVNHNYGTFEANY